MLRTITCLSLVALLAGCGNFPYRIDVDQGNIVSQKALSRLQIGMTKQQVQQTLGSTLLSDIFHRDRWDYIRYYKQGKTQSIQESKVSLYFTNGLLRRIDSNQFKAIDVEPVPYSVVK